MNKQTLVLAIDTSCDETSVAITVNDSVIANVISSQVELHKKWGGVVPIIAKRAHEERIDVVIKEAFKRASVQVKKITGDNNNVQMAKRTIDISTIDAIAVTVGPGLAPCLEVGISKAKELALTYNKPLYPVNHMEGHLLSALVKNSRGNGTQIPTAFPLIALLISGGHTQLVLMKEVGAYELLGETLDDAVGEAFDKVAKMLDLGYPGGPIIETLAKNGNAFAYNLPIPMRKRHDDGLDFSYSGIKTAVLYLTKQLKAEGKLNKQILCDLAASFQRVVALSLSDKLEIVSRNIQPKGLLLGGGVISNRYIRTVIKKAARKLSIPVYTPTSINLCTDNAAMIGVCAYVRNKSSFPLSSSLTIERQPNLSF